MPSRADRAKIFLPFAALTGLEEALRETERLRAKQAELSEDRVEEIDRALKALSPGMQVRLVFYAHEAYNHLTGTLEQLRPDRQLLTVDGQDVPFAALLEAPEILDP